MGYNFRKIYKFIPLLFVILFSCSKEPALKNFITVSGNKLMDGEKEFRFISFNAPNLNFNEDEMSFDRVHPFALPTEFEIRDAMQAMKQMGGSAMRMYTFPVTRETDTLDVPKYVIGPGKFDEHSFLTMDTVLAVANEEGMRLIVPFMNNWQWMGGRPQYARFRDKDEKEFWTDPQLIADFKETIKYVLNRKNTVTGEYYKDDKAIMCWETGNELYSTPEWTNDIVGLIKSIDTNHLVMDGYFAIDATPIQEESIDNPLIDILSSHHYALDPKQIIHDIKHNVDMIGGKKPFIVGEFGFLGVPAIEQICDFIIDNGISGGLLWSLRAHREKGGYYWHSEPLGGGIFKAFHYPGFESGIEYNEKALMDMLRRKAYKINNMEVPPLEKPGSPIMLPIKSVSEISWTGSAGAYVYDVERREADSGDWEIVGYNVSDADKYYAPLFIDKFVELGKEYYYRVTAKSPGGKSDPSNEVGPVKVDHFTYVHDMRNLTGMYYYTGKFRMAGEEDRLFKEIMDRIEVEKGSEMFYWVPGKIIDIKVHSFSKADSCSFAMSLSNDNTNYDDVASTNTSCLYKTPDYDYWYAIQSKVKNLSGDYNYLKLTFNELAQMARVEISYIPDQKAGDKN